MKPIGTAELAERLGKARAWLYRPVNLERLYAEGMPRPMSGRGHKQWDRAAMLAWLGRHHPAINRAANDPLPPPPTPAPDDDRGWQQKLANVYGAGR